MRRLRHKDLQGPVVLVPAYNEAKAISTVVAKIRSFGYPALVIDDGSSDLTSELALSEGASVARTEPNRGLGHALSLGFKLLVEHDVTEVITMDGDGVHDAQFIDGLLETHRRAKAAITIGSRFLSDDLARGVPDCKRAANRFAALLSAKFLSTSCSDILSGMRVLSQEVLKIEFASDDYAIAVELIEYVSSRALRLAEHPIRVQYNADELHCTQGLELRQFLRFCRKNLKESDRTGVDEILRGLNSRDCICVRINGIEFFIHRLVEREAFIFQQQQRREVERSPTLQIVEL